MAAKKSFKGTNPAMQFISIVAEEPQVEVETVVQAEPKKREPVEKMKEIRTEKSVEVVEPVQSSAAPAPVIAAPKPVRTVAEKPQAHASGTAERKSKRLNLLLQPSLLQDAHKIAHMQQKSVNDLIHVVLKEYCKKHADAIETYDKIFGK